MKHLRLRAMASIPVAVILACTLGLAPTPSAVAGAKLDLAGAWRFEIDRQDAGLEGRWFARPLVQTIQLPGSMPGQGFGDPVTTNTVWTGQIVDRSWFEAPEYAPYRQPGNVKIPFWLQPETHYVGAAWYQRDLEIPREWQGKRVVLTLERPHWETKVWVDDRAVGANNSLSTPHEYDLGTALSPGRHRLTVRVDNRMVVDVGINSHSVTDHTQGNWNGLVGQLTLEVTPPVWVDDLQVYPDVARRAILVRGRVGNASGKPGQGTVSLQARQVHGKPVAKFPAKSIPVAWDASGGAFEADYPMGETAGLWDEFSPVVYALTAGLSDAGSERTVTFGLREIHTEGTQFVINGRKTFIRGTLECAIFPRTGHPPTDVKEWKRIIGAAKAHGLNNFRFHSWCPPEAAFVAADELGFYLNVECASWANTTTSLGEGKPIDRWLYEETDRILKAYGNHPSFVLFPYGNEPAGKDKEYLGAWVKHYRAKDPRRLYTSAAGWPQIPENQFHLTPDPRIQAWGEGLKSRINARPPETVTDYRDYIRARPVPVISHEIGQWCVYPNFDEMPKYRGYLKPRNFEIFRETLAAHHMLDQAGAFLLASGKLQTLCYKEEIESALRTPGMGGFQLLDLHDFPGQGTALVGVLDPFWESKGYVTAAEYNRFSNATVPLARLKKRVFTTAECLETELEVSHFGARPLPQARVTWRLETIKGKKVAGGKLPPKDIPVDNGVSVGSVRVPLQELAAPAQYRFVAGIAGTAFENDWDVWVYPQAVQNEPPASVSVVRALDAAAWSTLQAGGRVLFLAPRGKVKGDRLGKVGLGFSSIFWNTAWTQRQLPHTLGILCDPSHPALAAFPTEFHSNWQWWYLVTQAQAMILDELPPGLRPVVQVIDDWFTNRRLGLVFEGRVGRGHLLVCSIALEGENAANPVSRQFYHSLLKYMGGNPKLPVQELEPGRVQALFD